MDAQKAREDREAELKAWFGESGPSIETAGPSATGGDKYNVKFYGLTAAEVEALAYSVTEHKRPLASVLQNAVSTDISDQF